MNYSRLIVYFFSVIYIQSINAEFSFKSIYDYVVPNKTLQEIVYEEYHPQKANLFTCKNKRGNVTIKVDEKSNKIFLKAIKKSTIALNLPKLTFAQKHHGHELSIECTHEDQIEGSIDFEIIIPKQLTLNIASIQGNILIKDSQTPLRASTNKGSLEIINARNSIDVNSLSKGSISISHASGRIKAKTNSGNILIKDANASITATTNYGSIEMFAKDIPSTAAIKLSTISGNIKLHLPPDTNADLQAYTKQGIITSDHFITLKPQTTQLNKQAWKRFQKQIEGTLGSGEAQIHLSSIKSDIKLLELKLL